MLQAAHHRCLCLCRVRRYAERAQRIAHRRVLEKKIKAAKAELKGLEAELDGSYDDEWGDRKRTDSCCEHDH